MPTSTPLARPTPITPINERGSTVLRARRGLANLATTPAPARREDE